MPTKRPVRTFFPSLEEFHNHETKEKALEKTFPPRGRPSHAIAGRLKNSQHNYQQLFAFEIVQRCNSQPQGGPFGGTGESTLARPFAASSSLCNFNGEEVDEEVEEIRYK